VSVLSDIYFVFFMCLVSIVVCVGSLWYLCCILRVSCVYCCVCRFSLIFILSSSCVLCLLLCVSVLSDIYFVFFMCLVSIVVCVGSLWYLFIDNELIWILSTFITYHRICNKRNTTGDTWGTGITYPPGAPEFNLRLSGDLVARFLVFCVMFCRSLCVLSFGHCVVYSSSIYGFWLPLWYLQTCLRSHWSTGNTMAIIAV
jgi:hypothetical protein